MALIYEPLLARQSFDPSCPSGGTWYACTTGSRFLGCCTGTDNPCDNSTISTGCTHANLKPASFNTSDYGKFPDQTCATGSSWYTCNSTNPPFMGCCKSNPCASGCPTNDLTVGLLSRDEASAAPFTITSSASSTSMAAATSVATTPTAAASATSSADSGAISSDDAGAIAGGVIGGLAGLALILIGLLWWMKRVRQARQRRIEESKMDLPVYGQSHSRVNSSYGPSTEQPPAPQYSETPPRTHSQESPEGIEVSDRPEPPSSEPYLSPGSQKLGPERPTSIPYSSNWPFRSSIPNFSPIFTHSDASQQFRSSFHEGGQTFPPWYSPTQLHSPTIPNDALPFANQSPALTPIQNSHPEQTDYFGSYTSKEKEYPKRQRPISYELPGSQVKQSLDILTPTNPQRPISIATEFFELADTQRSPPIELPAHVPGERKSFNDAEYRSGMRQSQDDRRQSYFSTNDGTVSPLPRHSPTLPTRHSPPLPTRHPYSPDDVGSHRWRGD